MRLQHIDAGNLFFVSQKLLQYREPQDRDAFVKSLKFFDEIAIFYLHILL